MTERETRIADIEARAAAATKGPWRYKCEAYVATSDEAEKDIADQLDPNDGLFVAHAREDVPWLVAEVRALESKLAEVTARAERAERERDDFLHKKRAGSERASETIAALTEDVRRLTEERDEARAQRDEFEAQVHGQDNPVRTERRLAKAEVARLTAELARRDAVVRQAYADLCTAYRHWDADRDSKVGKIIGDTARALKAALATPEADADPPTSVCPHCGAPRDDEGTCGQPCI